MTNSKKKKKQILFTKQNKKRGVVLFIAVTVSSLVLVIGIGILNVMTKEMILGGFITKSREAFYAADSGVECAMHWDLVQIIDDKHPGAAGTYFTDVFATSSDSVIERNTKFIGGEAFSTSKYMPFCAGQDASVVFDSNLSTYFNISNPASFDAVGGIATTQFVFFPNESDIGDVRKPCTLVTIEKEPLAGFPAKVETRIYSEGFSSCDSNDIRRVSRGVMVRYEI